MTKFPPDDYAADLAILIAAAWRAVTDELQATVVADEPLMRPAFGFVIRAVDSESPTITRLAELLGTTKQAASLLADEVEAAGFIERFTPPERSPPAAAAADRARRRGPRGGGRDECAPRGSSSLRLSARMRSSAAGRR